MREIGGAVGVAAVSTVPVSRAGEIAGEADPAARGLAVANAFHAAFWVMFVLAALGAITAAIAFERRAPRQIEPEPAPSHVSRDAFKLQSARCQVSDRLPATVVVRSVPLLTVRCGTRVPRPANDVGSAWRDGLQLERWARPGQATPASLSEYIASADERPVRPDRPDASGPGTSSNRQRPRTGVDLTGGER
jgi:hypothetical protein